MRVAVINQHPADVVGGSELQCDLFARGLARRGHLVRYVAVRPEGWDEPAAAVADEAPYELVRVSADAQEIVTACARSGADVAYWRFNRALLRDVGVGLRREGIALVFATAHMDDVSRWPVRPFPRTGPLRDRASELRARVRERSTWSGFSLVTAIASQRHDFLGRAPVQRQRLVRNLMPEAVADFRWPRPYVAWVGSVQQRKRPELLPRIAEAVEPYGIDVLFAGQLRDQRFAGLVRPPEGRENLHHLGILDQATTVGLLAGARLLAVTADEEGFANVLIQAWWAGTPTVSLSHDPDRLIGREDLGRACGGDVGLFLRSVGDLIREDDDARAARAQRIRTFARAEFDAERTLSALETLLRDAVAER